MSSYSLTKSRAFQYVGILLVLAALAVGYWYFSVRASTLNKSPTSSLTSGLVGYWTFDGADISGTTATDRSGNANNGTLTNGPTITEGKLGQALNFDGVDDYVTVADPGTGSVLDFANGTSITMSVWIKPDTFDGTYGVMASKEVNNFSGSANYQVYHQNCSGSSCQFGFAYDTGSCNGTGWNTFLTTASVLTAGQWQHVIETYTFGTGSTAKLYLNGVEQTASWTAGSGNLAPCQGDERIIIGHTYDGDMFDGSIDEVRVYNRALSAGEVKSLYDLGAADKVNTAATQPGSAGLASGLAGYWKLDENTGTSAGDASTNGNSGTLTNGPTWTSGQIKTGVDFDGTNDYITVADPASGVLDAVGDQYYTLSGWFNRDTATTVDTILAKSNGPADTMGYLVYLDATTDKLVFDTRSTLGNNTLETTSAYTTPGWHHFAIIFNIPRTGGNFGQIYIDGVIQNDNTIVGGYAGSIDSTRAFVIGAESDGGNPFDGKLDDIRIYNRSLSAEEVADLYRLTTPTGVDTSLKGYWSFNGQDMNGTTAYDRSGSGNNGTLTNGPTKTIGKIGSAVTFDGTNDEITIPHSAALEPDDLTLSVWVKRNGTQGTNDQIIGKDTSASGSNTWSYALEWDSGGTAIQWEVDDNSLASFPFVTSAVIPDATWTLVTGTYKYTTKTLELFVNGVSQGTTALPGTRDKGTTGIVLGRYNGGGGEFNGSIDDVRIYNRALSANEVKSLYDLGASDKVNSSISQPQGTGRLDSGLAGYWKLDENTGTSAGDASTNGNSGTLTNGPTWTTGQIGSAVNFDGVNDDIGVSDAPALDFGVGEAFSYAGWFNLSAVDGNEPLVMKSANDVSQGYGLFIHTTDLFSIMLNDATDDCSGTVDLNTTLTGAWHHYVWSVDTSHISRLYVDGSLRLTTDCSVSGDLSNADDLSLGWMYAGTSQYFSGKQDDIRLYNRALSADEAADLYRLTTPTGIDTGLKGYWSFNGQDMNGTTAYDRSGSGNNGTLTNGPTKAIGKIGQGLQFDGTSQYVSSNVPVSGDITLSAWIYPTNGQEYEGIIARPSQYEAGNYRFLFRNSVRSLEYQFASGSVHTSNSSIPYNQWSHVAVTFNDAANSVVIYVNGAVDYTGTETVSPSTANAYYGTLIGASNIVYSDQYFKGKIDDARIYSRTLSAQEVAAIYNMGR